MIMKNTVMTTIFLKVSCSLSLATALVGCTVNTHEDVNTTLICSDIFDAFMNGDKSDIITDECFTQLQESSNQSAAYDSKQMEVDSVFVDGKYICVCSIECSYDSYDIVNASLYKITFTYDEELSKVTSAEVQNYATV